MAMIMNLEGVLRLAKRLVEENPHNLNDSENYLLHLSDTYLIAEEIVNGVIKIYPRLNERLISEEVSLAAGLHDIGRSLRKNQLFHELRGARYIEENGLEIGVTDSITDVYRIAQMFRPHYVVAEQFDDEENKEERKEFEPLDSRLLTPRTWQEAIVVYSELSNVHGGRIPIQKRIDDIWERYKDPKLNSTNPSLLRCMKKGLPRVLETCEAVQKLVEGKLSEKDIARYGFI